MNLEKVIFGFFTIFACTLNFGFFPGDMDRPQLHHPSELFATIIVNLIALVIKFGDRTQLGATHLATSLVATLQVSVSRVVMHQGAKASPGFGCTAPAQARSRLPVVTPDVLSRLCDLA